MSLYEAHNGGPPIYIGPVPPRPHVVVIVEETRDHHPEDQATEVPPHHPARQHVLQHARYTLQNILELAGARPAAIHWPDTRSLLHVTPDDDSPWRTP